MEYWKDGVVQTAILVAFLLFLGGVLARRQPFRRIGVPVSILGGTLGLLLGPDVLAVLPLDRDILESIVYHGLGIVFIAVALQSPPQGRRGAGAASMAFAIPALGALQGFLGLGAVLVLGAFGLAVHPGVGALLPYGFEQGPGQALSIGSAWEANGLTSGADLGLLIAAIGFAWSILFGIPLVAIGRARGWIAPHLPHTRFEPASELAARQAAGTLEVLTTQVVAISLVYGLTYLALLGVSTLLSGVPDIAAMVWGFHFVLGTVLAIPVRSATVALYRPNPLNDETLGRINGLCVDVITVAALGAVQLSVFRANWFALLSITTLGGAVTLLGVVWVARRAFPDEPFEHAVALFGMATGTLPMGLALLRVIDPELKGMAPSSCVLGSAGAVPLAGLLYVVVLPLGVLGGPSTTLWVTLGALLYMLVVVGLWRLLGPLRFYGPLTALWPEVPEARTVRAPRTAPPPLDRI